LSRFFSGLRGRIGAFLGPDFRIPLPTPVLDERETFVRRTLVGALVVGAAGGMMLLLFGRAGWAIAFSLGAAVSLGNFHLITRAVGRLADPNPTQASRHLWKGALFRFAAVGIVLFLAVGVFRVNILALLAGLVITQLGMIMYWLWRSVRPIRNDQ
jgi:hypothetical protein